MLWRKLIETKNKDMLEYTGIDLENNRTYTFKLKDGCKIKVTAG